ncbi:MAG: alpha-L-rhamnosidase C-terminal domain-containing protein [Saprospiraceae bacterium]
MLQYLRLATSALLSFVFLSLSFTTQAQSDPDRWEASWITHPTESGTEYGVYHFRKVFQFGKSIDTVKGGNSLRSNLIQSTTNCFPAGINSDLSYLKPLPQDEAESRFWSSNRKVFVRVSADQRYILYVNGKEVSRGPARGDLLHWRYEKIDIRPFLKRGENTISATVWNFGDHTPLAQMSLGTSFILEVLPQRAKRRNGIDDQMWCHQVEACLKARLNTNSTWQVLRISAYQPEVATELIKKTYAVVGPGDRIDGTKYPWGWKIGAEDTTRFQWVLARSTSSGQAAENKGNGYGVGTAGTRFLVRREIPKMRTYEQPWGQVRRSKGITKKSKRPYLRNFFVAPNTTASVLLESDEMRIAYPKLTTSKGRGSRIEVMYQEALVDGDGTKGNRSEIEGKTMLGHKDVYLPNGGAYETYEPLWYRAYRYIQIDITTGDDTLFIGGMHAQETGYPFEQKASVSVNGTDTFQVNDIWRVGWRTAQLCAHETYMDCPYYEQLQYVGDTRIQALISLYVSGDDRLMRRAIKDFDQSRMYFGLTQSRYPSSQLQVIPPYSLFWNTMVYDYAMHRNDPGFVREMLPGVLGVLDWYDARINRYGLLERTDWWNFVDWTEEWPWDNERREGGVPPQDIEGNSLLLTLQYAYALRLSEEIFRWQSDSKSQAFAKTLHTRRMKLLETIKKLQHKDTGLFPDLRGANGYSQHTQVMAVLASVDAPKFLSKKERRKLIEQTLERDDLIQATFYYKFYLFEAMQAVGLGDRYFEELQPWRDMLDLDLKTFAEKPEETRSDCHAWSASPNYHLLSLVAGVRPASPAFKEVIIRPSLGELQMFSATIAHRSGPIKVMYKRKGKSGLIAEISLPENTSGVIEWNGKDKLLTAGEQTVIF